MGGAPTCQIMGMNRCLAAVVVYHPDWDAFCENLKSYPQGVEGILVVANSPLSPDQTNYLEQSGMVCLQNQENLGVAQALNQAAQYAIQRGFDWLLTMDQDSAFGQVKAGALEQAMHLAPPKTAAIGVESLRTPEAVPRFVSVAFLLQSGTLFHLEIWSKLGPFLEPLFIDAVDHEFCLRARKQGYRILQYPSIPLIHQLGQTYTLPAWLFVFHRHAKTGISYHSPERERFIFRNNAWLIRQYLWIFPGWALRRSGYLALRILYALLLLPQKKNRLKNIRQGLSDSWGFRPYPS